VHSGALRPTRRCCSTTRTSIHTGVLAYVRSLDFWGRSGKPT
jgi:hypothetical protein